MNIQEGKIKVDLKRIMTRIMGALEFKTDPKARQEIIDAIKDDLEDILPKHGYVIFEGEDVEEANFYSMEPSNIGGMGPISLPGVDNDLGSGDVPAGVGSAKDRYEEELKKRKKKNKKKKSVLEFEEYLNEFHQIKPFEPEVPKGERLGDDDYEAGPANDPDAEMKERAKSLKRSRQVVTFRDFNAI